jgi:hypothetical protein
MPDDLGLVFRCRRRRAINSNSFDQTGPRVERSSLLALRPQAADAHLLPWPVSWRLVFAAGGRRGDQQQQLRPGRSSAIRCGVAGAQAADVCVISATNYSLD